MTLAATVGSETAAVSKVIAGAGNYKSTAEVSVTLTVAELIDGVYNSTGGGAANKTTPTAAQIVAAIPGCVVGSRFTFFFINGSGGAVTMVAGSGVTLSGTTTITSAKNRLFQGIVTNATLASEAVLLVGGAELA